MDNKSIEKIWLKHINSISTMDNVRKAVFPAMEEFAQQQAVDFYDWVDTVNTEWYDPKIPKKDRVLYTTTELYAKFIEYQQNHTKHED